ncbi:unnamed protein product [Brassicogethes aeneus]|uniref:Angiogenic factor with G patch and FHA domains 1 n=1 Tax=Brassicogethes aeneus TaxID=1431903 RepID=A0A9P0B0R5_BRAAE|nr:unnamed protein product [Brassicogethes aeneus]
MSETVESNNADTKIDKITPNEIVSSVDESDNSSKNKYELKEDMKLKLVEYPEILQYIEMLQRYIEKQRKKLKKWKTKIKKSIKRKEIAIQTDYQANNENESMDSKPKSLAEDIKDAAEQAMQNSGFVYEETSGMYYDYNTGYYYNAEYGLYYDGNTGTYYTYNQESQSYEFHSQVETPKTQEKDEKRGSYSRKKKVKRKKEVGHKTKAGKRPKIAKKSKKLRDDSDEDVYEEEKGQSMDVEEGECTSSPETSISDGSEADNTDSSDVSKPYPPCMRIITESTEVPKLKIGSLHIITLDGGTIGREGHHSITIPDINISKHHLKFAFEKNSGKYLATDLGSRNGTILNGKRMSSSKQESEPMEVAHGSKIQIGSTVLLCHVHDGTQTCGHCEPGLIQQQDEVPPRIYKLSKKSDMQSDLKNLKKRFGVIHSDGDLKLASGYTDRAQKRREEVGSQNPHEKTQTASVNESISSENKGFKLLSKMGWKEGESLGKDNEGIKEPVQVISNQGTAGIGSEELKNPTIPPTAPPTRNKNIWKKTQERFQKLPQKSDAFNEDDEDTD